VFEFRSLFAPTGAARRRPQRSPLRGRWRPRLEGLEIRVVPCGTEPWCYDTTFSGDGHQTVNIADHLEEAHAVAIQEVDIGNSTFEERTLLAGHARASGATDFAIARLCNNGHLDDRTAVSDGGGGGAGFGSDGSGIVVHSFSSVSSSKETINAIAIQPAQHSSGCDAGSAVSDKIVVAGTIPVNVGFTQEVFGVARFCADGNLDTSWGGNHPEWDGNSSDHDPAGLVTVGFADSAGNWARNEEGFALAIEPDSNKVVVGGYALFPAPDASDPWADATPKTAFYAVGRMNTDDTCIAASLHPGCFDTTFGPNGSSDYDHGRIRFDGNGDWVPNHIDDQVRAIQLVPDQDVSGKYDIVIAGPDRVAGGLIPTPRDFLVARVEWDGGDGGSAGDVWDAHTGGWTTPTFVGFSDSGTARDDIPFALPYKAADGKVVVAGVTCTSASCVSTRDTETGDKSPDSLFAFARLDVANGTKDYDRKVGLASTHTNVAYGVVIQKLSGITDPFVVVGGYSVDSDNGTPYMSGSRFDYTDGSGSVTPFVSSFSGTSGTTGDQARGLRLQSQDNKVVAGGLHAPSSDLMFAALRLCATPSGSPCTDGGGTAPGGGGGGGGGGAGADLAIAVIRSDAPVSQMYDVPPPAWAAEGRPGPTAPEGAGGPTAAVSVPRPSAVLDRPVGVAGLGGDDPLAGALG
jgi:hypothetical protein